VSLLQRRAVPLNPKGDARRSPSRLLDPFAFVIGVVTYWLSKWTAELANLHRKPLTLDARTLRRIQLLIAGVDLSKVRIVTGAWLPAWIFHRSIVGMAYKDRVYVAARGSLETYEDFLLLIHELVHIHQFQRLGEFRFAGEYGKQFLHAGGYGSGMPLEAEAYGYVDRFRGRAFDPRFYVEQHLPHLDTSHPHWDFQALSHFLDHGLPAGLASHPRFCAAHHLKRHPDLAARLGPTNHAAALQHWLAQEEGGG